MMSVAENEVWCTSTPKRVPGEGTAGSGLRSVGTALSVLECFATDGELGVSDIARRLGIAKSTTHRLLQTLAERGFVEQNPESSRYRLGIHLYELGELASARHVLRQAALPHLQRVAAATGLTVNLSVVDGADVVFVERIENTDGVRVLGHMGRRLPAHTTSSGKAIAAFDPDADAERRRAGFPPRVSRTLRTESDWEHCLLAVRTAGYATSTSESVEGAASVAVPVLVGGRAIAAVSVIGPSELVERQVRRLVPVLSTAARRIARTRAS